MATTLGKYTLLRKLATGGMAEVFLARADGPGGFAKKCVVKRILPHFNDDPRFIEMFLGEATLAAQLDHPNLVQIFDFGQHDGQYFIAMEYIDGANLRELSRATRRQQGPMSLALAARIISVAAEGLHFAHELRSESGEFLNLVHRDISPDNILVARNGSVKVVDFGIAKASSQPHLTKSGMIKGKMAYMPPEQLARETLDRRADLFALGICFYELVTGGMPFDATSEVSIIQAIMSQKPLEKPTAYRPDCPPDLEAIIEKCLEKDRDRRYLSCVELQADIEQFIKRTGETVGTREIAQLVETTFAGEADATIANGSPATPAAQSKGDIPAPAPSQPAPLGTASGTGMSNTALRSVETFAVQKPTNKGPLIAGLGVLTLVAIGASAWFALKTDPLPLKPVVPPLITALDAGPVSLPDAGAQGPDAGITAEPDAGPAEPDAGPTAEVDAGAVVPVGPVAAKNGRLELRIRPYATVFLDDRKLGDTPLPAISVSVGRHKLRLVNPAFGKNVELNIVIHPGENVVKHNMKE